MTDYQKVLFLTYFKNCKEVDFTELNSILGLCSSDFDNLIQEMISENYISYINFKLQITDYGIRYLIARNQIECEIKNDEFILKNIFPERALPLDEPFIPQNFISKI